MSKMLEDNLAEPDASVIAELEKKNFNGLTIMVMSVEQAPKV